MLTAGFNVLVGVACGLRLTLMSFAIVMVVALGGAALLDFTGVTWLTELGELAITSCLMQTGYVCGLLVRAYAD